MTTTTFSSSAINDTDANFRAWGSAVAAGLAAIGFVKTADTGQINWATVLKPAGTSTYQGYEIWQFNDTLQATAPLFVKLEYGSGTAVNNPALRFTIGKGSDGAGGLTGVLLAATTYPAPNSTATAGSWYMSSGDGSMWCFAPYPGLFTGPTNQQWNITLERSRNQDGTASAAGFHISWQVTNTVNVRVVNYATGATFTDSAWPVALPGATGLASLTGAGKTPLFPATLTDGQGNWWQPRCILVGTVSDIGNLSPITVEGFGVYLPITGMLYFDEVGSGSSASRAAIAWF